MSQYDQRAIWTAGGGGVVGVGRSSIPTSGLDERVVSGVSIRGQSTSR